MKSVSLAEQREHFPGLQHGIYADTAAAGLLHRSVVEWRHQHDLDLMEQGSRFWPEHSRVLKETREGISKFFHTGNAEVALLQNFSIGLNLLIECLDPGMTVLLVEEDYPSVNWPFEKRGFNISYVQANEQLEFQIVELLSKKKIDILALSIVQWLTGIKVTPAFLKRLKQDFPSLIIIADGTQFCGAFDFDFSESGIDVMGSSGYKWLLGGYGNGFMIISQHFANNFRVPAIGFNSAEGDLEGSNGIPNHKRLEPGHLDSLNFGSLNYSMNYLSKLGMDSIENHNRSLISRVRSEIGAMGLLQEAVYTRDHHGTIFRLVAGRQLYDHLIRNQVRCSWRSGGIRLSFHFYNTEAELDRLVQIIKNGL